MDTSIASLRERLEAAVYRVAPNPLTVAALVARFMEDHVARCYPMRKGSSEFTNFREAFAPLTMLYGDCLAATFTPVRLQAVRQFWIEQKLCRSTVNARTRRIRQLFRWAVSLSWLAGEIAEAIDTVTGLRAGRSQAKEPKQVKPVSMDIVRATMKECSPVIRAMLRVQYHAAMRPGELVAMRGCEIDRTNADCWTYTPTHHKCERWGKARHIALGPHCIELLHTRLNPSFIFTTEKGNAYRVLSYYRAVARAAARAGVPHFHVNQIRHTAATEIREMMGLDAAQVVLGHSRIETTQRYAEAQTKLQTEAALRFG